MIECDSYEYIKQQRRKMNLIFTNHAKQRIKQRRIKEKELKIALQYGKCQDQYDRDAKKYVLDDLQLVVSYNNNVVITVYRTLPIVRKWKHDIEGRLARVKRKKMIEKIWDNEAKQEIKWAYL